MTNLAKTAMLVSVQIANGGLLGERKDSKASALVQDTYLTADRRTKASKFLIDRNHKAVREVMAASQRAREIVYKYTLPWGEDKTRILPVKLTDIFRAKIATAIADLGEARENYLLHYPTLVSASENDLGSLFDASQYPGVERIRDLFKSSVTYWPMPESGHFLAELSAGAAKEAQAGIEREIEERLIEATYDMVKRAKKVVAAFVDKLENFKLDDKGKPETIFRDSLITNIEDTSKLISAMNLTGNAEIAKVCKDLDRLVYQTNLNALRASNERGQLRRKEALTAGQEILINLTMLDLKDQEVSDMVADAGEYM